MLICVGIMSKTYNELYQLKVDVGVVNTVKIYRADISSVSGLALCQNKRQKDPCSDEGLVK